MSCENDSFGGNMEFKGSTIDLNKGYSLSQEIKTRFLANNLIQELELQEIWRLVAEIFPI